MKKSAFWAAVAAALVLAAGLRLAGIGYGLPHTFNADEPHIVNLSVSFGRGSLNPYSFKYPTLWPTLLFFCYGLYFLVWSGFGAWHSVGQFVAHFAWEPTGFYLIGRVLTALFTLLGAAVIWRAEVEARAEGPVAGGPAPWGALLLAFSPALVDSSHTAKPDGLMLFFACLAWYFALKLYREGRRRWHWACGACAGLAFSSQYTGIILFTLLPLAHFLSRRPGRRRWLFEGTAAAAAAFFIGSPYIVLEFPRFWESIGDFSFLSREMGRAQVLRAVLLNFWNFAGAGSVAGIAALAGAARLCAKERRAAGLLLGPIVACAVFFSSQPDGGWMRYVYSCFPAMALLASEGLNGVARDRRGAAVAFLALVALLPGVLGSWLIDRKMMLPDTRATAREWIEAHIPAGATLLLDFPHASPRLAMTKEQTEELAEKTRQIGSPRSRLYRALADSHPGGGYRIFRIQRSATDLRSTPRHVALSEADAAVLDVRAGLDHARAMRVEYVVTSTFGANPARSRELASFFEQLCAQAELAQEFAPQPGVSVGPLLRVYRLVSYTLRR